ncbi:MAG TPA: hypothetical protein VJK52_01615, partial [Candidatus Nanoarchaeia archaeon]|nr:hypothetical protein [Candidatus Nanoarchaeia archaeon]
MVGLSGRIVAVGKGQVQIELMNSGQIIDLASSIPFSIGDPVLVSSDQGKPVGVIRAAKKFVVSSAVNE